jgi:hypothetical protein
LPRKPSASRGALIQALGLKGVMAVQIGTSGSGYHTMYSFLTFALKSAFVASLTLSCSCAYAQSAPQHDLNADLVQAKLKFCELVASFVESMAVERDKGVPLSDLYARLPDNKYFPRAQNLKAAEFVYANPSKSPSDFKKAVLNECYKNAQDKQ